MIRSTCLVQAGQISAETEAALRAGLDAFTQRAFGAPADIGWTAIPQGGGFTARKPSTTSVVAIRADAPLEQKRREALLNELCDLWIRETNCSHDEVVGVISDPEAT